jgi:hypothetical protein
LVQKHLEHCEICSAILDSTHNILILTADDRVLELRIGFGQRLHARLDLEFSRIGGPWTNGRSTMLVKQRRCRSSFRTRDSFGAEDDLSALGLPMTQRGIIWLLPFSQGLHHRRIKINQLGSPALAA